MPFYFFTWNDLLIEHLAENGVTPEEFEQVVCNPDRVDSSRTSGAPIAFGYTEEGRYLACIYQMLDADSVLPGTAYELEE